MVGRPHFIKTLYGVAKTSIPHDKTTDVAFIDICEAKPDAHIGVTDVTEILGLRCQVLARIDVETGTLLGLIIEDFPAIRREIRRKYIALAVDKIIDLIVSKVKDALSSLSPHRQPALTA